MTDKEFKQWFSGFVDAEGLFYRKLRKNGTLNCFLFEIHLHLDDLGTLNYIKNRLGIGKVRVLKNSAWFFINKLAEIEILISVFEEFSL